MCNLIFALVRLCKLNIFFKCNLIFALVGLYMKHLTCQVKTLDGFARKRACYPTGGMFHRRWFRHGVGPLEQCLASFCSLLLCHGGQIFDLSLRVLVYKITIIHFTWLFTEIDNSYFSRLLKLCHWNYVSKALVSCKVPYQSMLIMIMAHLCNIRKHHGIWRAHFFL